MEKRMSAVFLIRNASGSKHPTFRIKTKEKSSTSPLSSSQGHPKSHSNFTRTIKLSTKQENLRKLKKKSFIQDTENLSKEKEGFHKNLISGLSNLQNVGTLLDYNFEIVENLKNQNLLSQLISVPPPEPVQFSQSTLIDLTRHFSKSQCSVCKNVFIQKSPISLFTCDECKKGNVLKKYTGCIAQVVIQEKIHTKTPSFEFSALFTDRSNPSPQKLRAKQSQTNTLLNILLPDFASDQEASYSDIVENIQKICEKAKYLEKDCLTLIQEMPNFDIKNIKKIESTIEEFAKRTRILLKDTSSFLPDHSKSFESIFKGLVSGINSLISSCNSEIISLESEKSLLLSQINTQKSFKNDVKKLKIEYVISEEKLKQEIQNLQTNIQSYKYTISLYQKELASLNK